MVSRELRQNRGLKGYRPKQARQFALNRRKKARYRVEASTWILIEALIRQDCGARSKYRIGSKRTTVFKSVMSGSTSTSSRIRTLEEIDLRSQKVRGKRYGSYDRRGKLKNRVSIDERPAIVDTRQRPGDWEVDTIIGKGHRHAVVSLTERKSRLALLRKVERKTAQAVADVVIELHKSL